MLYCEINATLSVLDFWKRSVCVVYFTVDSAGDCIFFRAFVTKVVKHQYDFQTFFLIIVHMPLLQVTKPFHALFNDQSLENMKKLAEQYEEEEAKRKLAEPDTPAVITDVEDTNMDELLDAYADEDVDEIAENFGDVDEDVEDI